MTETATAARAPERRRGRIGQWDSPVTSYYLLLGICALLVLIGLAMVLSASSVKSLHRGNSAYAVFLSQSGFAILGLIAAAIASRIPVRVYRKGAWYFLGGAFLLQALIFTPLAMASKGNTNWIKLPGGQSLQPSELLKLGLCIWLGMVLARKQRLLQNWVHALIPALPVAGIGIGLVLAGHDLGTALILMAIVAGALWVAGVPARMFAFGAAIMGAIALFLIKFQSNQNRAGRIDAWLGNDCGAADLCYQAKHGLWALGTGGISGVGLGAGREKWLYLPEAHNDFIFAVIGEELGLPGTLLMLVLFALLGVALTRIIHRHPDPFVKITTGAIACWILGQALVNIGVVLGLLPVIGIPLPLVSAGGSALIATMAAIGVVLSFARDEPGVKEALAARPSVIRKSLAVLGGRANRNGKTSK